VSTIICVVDNPLISWGTLVVNSEYARLRADRKQHHALGFGMDRIPFAEGCLGVVRSCLEVGRRRDEPLQTRGSEFHFEP